MSDLVEAFEFVSMGELAGHEAYVCRTTGKIIFVPDVIDLDEGDPPADLDDDAQYLPVPDRRALDLGKPLALSFIDEELPGSVRQAREIFGRRGAYGRFKGLLQTHGLLDKWYAFEQAAIEAALRDWSEDVGITLIT